MENPDLVLQETGSRSTYSRLNYVPSGDTLRRDAFSSFHKRQKICPTSAVLHCSKRSSSNSSLHWALAFYPILSNGSFFELLSRGKAVFDWTYFLNRLLEVELDQISTSASVACTFYLNLYFWTSTPPLDSSLPSRQWLWTWVQHSSSRHLSMSPQPYPSRLSSTTNDIFRCMQSIWCSVVVKVQNS